VDRWGGGWGGVAGSRGRGWWGGGVGNVGSAPGNKTQARGEQEEAAEVRGVQQVAALMAGAPVWVTNRRNV